MPRATMDFMNFTLRQLTYFVATAETGSIFHAAARLHVSQSALSAALNELERILDTQLFVRRKARGVTLTVSGKRALEQARVILKESGELGGIASSSGFVGPIEVGCFSSLSPIVLPRLLQGFTAIYPHVTLDYSELDAPQIEQRLRAGGLDLGIVHEWGVPHDFRRAALTEMRPYLLLPADHWARERAHISLEELRDETLILPAANPSKDHTLSLLRAAGVNAHSIYDATSFELTRALVGRGLGYAVSVQRSHNTASHEGFEVISREIADDIDPVRILMVWPEESRLTARVEALVAYARGLDWGDASGG